MPLIRGIFRKKKTMGNNDLIEVTISYKTELLGVILILSDYPKMYPHLFKECANQTFKDKIIKNFSKYKNEKVIASFNELIRKHPAFSYNYPLELFLELDSNFKTQKLSNKIFYNCLNQDKSIYSFINELYPFAQKIDFEKYYNRNKKEYEKYINAVLKILQLSDVVKYTQNYFKYNNGKKIIINLTPYFTSGNYSCFLTNTVYINLSTGMKCKKENIYDLTGREKNKLDLIFHEYAHSYINPITEKYFKKNKELSFKEIEDKMNSIAYNQSETIINEHIIRALENRYIINELKDKSMAEERIKEEKQLGFIYIEPIIEVLKEYEKTENITIENFYPKIINKIIQAQKSNKIKILK